MDDHESQALALAVATQAACDIMYEAYPELAYPWIIVCVDELADLASDLRGHPEHYVGKLSSFAWVSASEIINFVIHYWVKQRYNWVISDDQDPTMLMSIKGGLDGDAAAPAREALALLAPFVQVK